MSAEIHVFRCLTDNIGVLLHDSATGATAAVDAPEEMAVWNALQEKGWRLTDILVTHRHADHIQGIPGLKSRTACRVVAPAKARIAEADLTVSEGDKVNVGSLQAEVLETPGHCVDHVAYWFAAQDILFAGDTLFTLGCGRVVEGSIDDLWHSLKRLRALPDGTLIFSGHDYTIENGRFARAADPNNEALQARCAEAERAAARGAFLIPSTMAIEKATNPFLRADTPALAKAVDWEGTDPAAVFQALREWKNRF